MSLPDPAILHADPLFVVIDKPAGMLSVPGKGDDKKDCAIARVARLFPAATGPMIVHRLDMDTSGLLVVALRPDSQRQLSRQFEARVVHKRYTALVDGIVTQREGLIDFPMRPDITRRPYQIRDDTFGRPAVTRYRVLSFEIDRTRLEFEPITGRAHQLRFHAAHHTGLNHPILGDVLYGSGFTAEHPRLMLHASYLSFHHPTTGQRMEFTSTCPF